MTTQSIFIRSFQNNIVPQVIYLPCVKSQARGISTRSPLFISEDQNAANQWAEQTQFVLELNHLCPSLVWIICQWMQLSLTDYEAGFYIRWAGIPENTDKYVTRTDFMFVSQTCSVSRSKQGGFPLLSQPPHPKFQVEPHCTSPGVAVLLGQARCSVTPVLPRAAGEAGGQGGAILAWWLGWVVVLSGVITWFCC